MSRTNRLVLSVSLLVLLAAVPGGFVGPASAAGNGCSFPVTKTDATGTQVTIDAEPQRIVTLAPSAAQTMWEIGGKSKVVAVTSNADYLSGTGSLPTISTYPSVDSEAVVNQTPDLVLAPDVIADDDVDTLRSSGLTVYNAREAKTIEDVYSKTLVIGRLTGECSGAKSTVSWMRSEIGKVRETVRDRAHPTTFYHMGGGWTAGDDTFINEILTTSGASNVAAGVGISGYRVMSSEQIVQQDPAWIVRGDNAYAAVPTGQLPYSSTTAVKRDQILVVDDDYINQAAPRIVYVIETIAEGLHPDVDIDVSSGGPNADLTRREPSVSRTTATDGTVTLSVEDLYDSRTVDLDLSQTTVTGDGVSLTAVNLSLAAPNPSFAFTVDPGVSLPSSVSDEAATVVLGTFEVSSNGLLAEDVSDAQFRFSVPRDDLSRVGAGPDRVVLYRYHDGEWTTLETELVGQSERAFHFVGHSPGTSIFAVGVPRTSAALEDVSLEPRRLTVGEPVTARATVANPGVAPITVPLSLSVGGEVLTTKQVTVAANSTATVDLSATVTSPGTHQASIGSRDLGEITVLAPATETPAPTSTQTAESPTADADRSKPATTTPATGTDTLIHETGQPGFDIGIGLVGLFGALILVTRYRGESG